MEDDWFDTFCDEEPIWDWQLTWNTTKPLFTRCFQKTISVWVPTVYLWFLAPLSLYLLLRRSPSSGTRCHSIAPNLYNCSRLVLVIVAILVHGIQLMHDLYYFAPLPSLTQTDAANLNVIENVSPNSTEAETYVIHYSSAADLTSSLLWIASFSLFAYMTQQHRKHGRHTSGVAWFFTFLAMVFALPSLYMTILLGESNFPVGSGATCSSTLHLVLFILHFTLLVLIFLFTCFADLRSSTDLSLPELLINDVLPEVNGKFDANFVDSFELKSPYEPTGSEETNTLMKNQPKDKKETTRTETQECPELAASFLSQITFWWFGQLAVTGFKKSLTMDDLWELRPDDLTKKVAPKFDRNWNSQLKTSRRAHYTSTRLSTGDKNARISVAVLEPNTKDSKAGVFTTLFYTFGSYFLFGAIFKLANDLLQFVNPQLLKLFIAFVSELDQPLWHGFFIAALFFIVSTLQSMMLNVYFTIMYTVGMRVRTAFISAIYRKALNLSNTARRDTTTGEIVNLMSVDAQRFVDLLPFINLLWSSPLQICLTIYFLWMELGPSVLAGLLIMVLLIPINGFISAYQRKLQMSQMKTKDERVKVINELLNGIRVIKLYAWEIPFIRKVTDIRGTEIDYLKKIAYIGCITSFLWTTAPFLVSFVTFAIYVLSSPDNVLDAKKAFVSLSLFNLLRFPLSMLPQMISMLVASLVSVNRLNRFLNSPQLEKYVEMADLPKDKAISIEKADFTWEKENSKKSEKPEEEENLMNGNASESANLNSHAKNGSVTLSGIDLNVKKGSLVAVVGQVGSGKSSLLSAILGEMDCLKGKVQIQQGSTVAYVAQQAWIQNATLKENILFGNRFVKDRYDSIIEMCALKPDIAILPGGDQTEIGEKGINLSGGQKQRVAMARACYAQSDIILLDDPLSAVDSHVASHIFNKVLSSQSGFLRDRTRIFVTNNIALLPEADQIVVLVNGAISEIGTYQQLMENSGKFAEFVREYSVQNEEESKEDSSIADSMDGSLRRRTTSNAKDDVQSPGSVKRQQSVQEQQNAKQLIESERAETGQVKLSIYLSYFRSLTWLWLSLTFLGFIGMQSASVGANVWLAIWSNDFKHNSSEVSSLNINTTNTEEDDALRNRRLGIFGLLGFTQTLFVLMGAFAMARGTVHSSSTLHRSLLERIMRSPMHFFDTTPLGRIVNRFSKDIDTVDSTIPHTIRGWLICFLQVLATFILISIEVPQFLFVAIPILLLYYFIQKFYVATSRQLKRLESVTRSPIYSHFGETLSGVSTIRAYGSTHRFITESNHRVDLNQRSYYPSFISNRWLSIRLEFCGNLIVFFAAIFAVFSRDSFQDKPGFAGLIITYALSVTQTFNWLVRMTSDMETNVVSVERIEEYCHNETEKEWTREKDAEPKLSAKWPEEGHIEFQDYAVRYRKGLQLVLNGINIEVKPGEKIGIVGRTGAGKSSLTLCLFRLLEAAKGKIAIDGIDISQIGLHELRSKLSIIPQDPILFSGTIRSNLDPFGVQSDEQLWQALEHSHLKDYVSSLEAGLDYKVSENGDNLSVGQRQLICLARALLRKAKILILDEATAAIDFETDALIQTTIRNEFASCTILTIAHRLNTIMDSSRVLVLERGRVVEFDAPDTLLQDRRTRFYGLAKDARLV